MIIIVVRSEASALNLYTYIYIKSVMASPIGQQCRGFPGVLKAQRPRDGDFARRTVHTKVCSHHMSFFTKFPTLIMFQRRSGGWFLYSKIFRYLTNSLQSKKAHFWGIGEGAADISVQLDISTFQFSGLFGRPRTWALHGRCAGETEV